MPIGLKREAKSSVFQAKSATGEAKNASGGIPRPSPHVPSLSRKGAGKVLT